MPLKHNADVLSLRVLFGVLVVLDVSAFCRIDSVVSPHRTVVAREPVGAALAEYDVAGDHILLCIRMSVLSHLVHRLFDIPPDFLAPRRFPGPSFALLTAPCWAWLACRTNVRTGEEAFIESRPNASLRQTCELPAEFDRPIDVSAARTGCCDRGSSIAGAGDERLFLELKYLIPVNELISHP